MVQFTRNNRPKSIEDQRRISPRRETERLKSEPSINLHSYGHLRLPTPVIALPLKPLQSLSLDKKPSFKMEASESEAIFDSLNLNPQLFINSSLNIVDELIDSAFSHLHEEASSQLKVDGSDRAEDLTKGLNYIRNMIQSAMDKRLTMWEKYCFLRVFVVPEGFSLPKDDEASKGDMMDVEAVGDPDSDAQLDSLRTKLIMAEQESVKLKREIQALERQSVISNHQVASVNELMKLSEQVSEDDAFKELQKLATELRAETEKLQTKRADDIRRARLCLWNGDLLRVIGGNGLSNAKPEEIEGFLAGMKPL
ncbi:hypothetical protein L1987_51666 [Smallanthus sonchifolius]|uniref:Uncharacterized protein n=1 Tax=Smallanthus sonchifolius TaxID=185202 RepID=A0ACB9EQX9_9ASTR|nr:hypothetical protein L1987_51666 [Smallanthus sonchifolius]